MKKKLKACVLSALISTAMVLSSITAYAEQGAKEEASVSVSASIDENDKDKVTIKVTVEKTNTLDGGRDSVKITATEKTTGNILVKTLWLDDGSSTFEEEFSWKDVYNGNYTLKAEYSGDKYHAAASVSGEFEVNGYVRPEYNGSVGNSGGNESNEESSDNNGSDGSSDDNGSGAGGSDGATAQPKGNPSNMDKPDYGHLTLDPVKGLMGSNYGIITANHDDHRSHWVFDELSALIWGGPSENYWKLQYRDGSYAKGNKAVDENGKSYENYHWEFINQKWWVFDSDGFAKIGWIYDENYDGWFYIKAQHGMQTGWICVGDKWYYMNPNKSGCEGMMYAAQWTPDGYYVDEDGAWDGRPQK